MDPITDTQKLEKLTEQNRNRQKTYYNNHKEKILQKKLAEREQIKEINKPPPPAPIIPTEFTLEQIIDVFTKSITSANTLKKYICDMKRVFKLSGITEFTGSLQEHFIIKESLENSKYSLSTIKGSFQSILVFIDYSNIDTKVKAKYDKCHKIFIIKCEDQNTKRKTDKSHSVMLFNEYKEKILEKFGNESQEYLIVSLYDEFTCRDDYGGIRILRNVPIDNGTDNYVFIDGNKQCSIILNTYKTSNLYGKMVRMLSPELSDIIISYIKRRNLCSFLFPENLSGLSRYIIDMNKKIGVKGGICLLRHMKVTDFLTRTDLTPEMRLEMSEKMLHSEGMQQRYLRGKLDPSLLVHCNPVNDITL